MNVAFATYLFVVLVTSIVVLVVYNSNEDGYATFIQRLLHLETRRQRTPSTYTQKRGPQFNLNSTQIAMKDMKRAGDEIILHLEDSIGGLMSGPLGMWRNGAFLMRKAHAELDSAILDTLDNLGEIDVTLSFPSEKGSGSLDSTLFEILSLEGSDVHNEIKFMQVFAHVYNNKIDNATKFAEEHDCIVSDGKSSNISCPANIVLYQSNCFSCSNSIAVTECTLVQNLKSGTLLGTGKLDFSSCAHSAKLIGKRVLLGDGNNFIITTGLLVVVCIVFGVLVKSMIYTEKVKLQIVNSQHPAEDIFVHHRVREVCFEIISLTVPWLMVQAVFGLCTPFGINGIFHPDESNNVVRFLLIAVAGGLYTNVLSSITTRFFQTIYDPSILLRNAYDDWFMNFVGLVSSIIAGTLCVFSINASLSFIPGQEFAISSCISLFVDLLLRSLLCRMGLVVGHLNCVVKVRNTLCGPSICRRSYGPFYTARDRHTLVERSNGTFCKFENFMDVGSSQGTFFDYISIAFGSKVTMHLNLKRIKHGTIVHLLLNTCGHLTIENDIPMLLFQDPNSGNIPVDALMFIGDERLMQGDY